MRNHKDDMELAATLPVPETQTTAPTSEALISTPTDGELLQRIAEKDVDAFDTLYRRYVRSVYGFAMRRLGDRPRAEDAVQEVFASVWRSASSYRPERGPGAPWLYAVARNAIVDRARAQVEQPEELPDRPSVEPEPPQQAEAAWVAWRVHRALEELPEHERDVLELAYWGELSQSEVATFLGIPLGTVKTRTRSALSRLAALLEGEL